MPRYHPADPVLLKLNSATVTALHNANIKCLEDLFGLSEESILAISGIGQKRGREIQRLLHSLPFDFLDESLPANPDQDPYAGIHPALAEHLSTGLRYGEKYLDRGLRYYQNGNVGQIKLVDEEIQEYHIMVTGTRTYTIKLLLEADQDTRVHCTCPAFSQWMYGTGCKHIYAAALAVAERQRLMRFEADRSGDYAYRQMLRSLKSAKSDLALKTSGELDYMLVYDQNEWNLYPKQIYPQLKAARKNSGRYGNYQWNNPWQDLSPGTPKDRMAVSYLKQATSYYSSYGNHTNNNDHSLGDVLDLLTDRNVYLKEGTKLAKKVRFQKDPFTPVMEIRRANGQRTSEKEGLSVELRLHSEEIDRHLNNVDIISLDPCWVRYGYTLARVESTALARKFFLSTAQESIQLPTSEIESFLQEFYPMLLE